MSKNYEEDVKIFKALCDEKRIYILELLKSGEKCACILIDNMNIGQSALSYHMKILCESGLVESRQEGKWTHYKLSKCGGEYASNRLLELTTPDLDSHPQCCK
ncbi:transcriptional regulator, ArsR family [Clostridium collagenovorans DSM 3089]|uniref:Transcriptional regulator, ArsR family n=1 Tax=Clostridium collagenovorans DSM 3089 TaxID=1121306 RepID=A0A1M5XRM2_9CLOT|nr:metalloregulator ArsR/SmtB family transcription factor [Clostridium collagenovorans]SHI02194.1 transcriptional regulator, ArsR family [Clostridium collagenovorans DSM 3089]